MEQLWGFMEVDAQEVFPLSTSEGKKRLGSNQLESDNGHKHALRVTNIECKHE